ncbi:unnamed protein product [Eruca vesicaria subsp. sativa]|uniref:CCHC-type domain-containing protein n=1 Tax=Eruca vesicaria subsp. sativa TaxID=29727 RepID=A0ABC8K0N1_ERUVS|nr:unnamed protein product [Eruca vesicaria subsp. sativa]
MVQIYSLCGKWKRNEKSQLEFVLDTYKFASFSEIDENVTYKDFLEMVIEDLSIDSQDIALRYELPSSTESKSPPVDIRNHRQLTTFFNKVKENSSELIPLCVTVNDKVNMIALENVGTNIESKTIHSGDNHSYVDESSEPEKQQELHGSIESNNIMSDSEAHNDRYEEGNHPFRFHPILAPCPISVEYSYSTRDSDGLHVNQRFKNKQELMLKMRKWALEWKFEFRSLYSDKSRVVLVCVDDKCTWRMRATKINSSSDVFVVKRYVHEHTCDTTGKSVNHKQATAKLVGTLICNNNGEGKDGLKPKQIIEQVRKEHGIEITYGKAWRAKEQVENLMRGTHGSEIEVLCSPNKQSNVRSTRKRMRSAGGSHKCSKCGREGHHKNTCDIPSAVEEESTQIPMVPT